MELSALPRMQCAVSGLVQAWKVRPRKRAREREGGRKEVCLFSTLLLICFYCWWNWALSERWGHNWIWLAFPWWSGNGSDVPVDWFVCLCDSESVCVCVCVCVFPCINTGTGDFTEQIFPLCFHSELGEIDDWIVEYMLTVTADLLRYLE